MYGVAALAVLAIFGTTLAGGILPTINKLKTPPPAPPLYTCCDSGEGAACQPVMTKTFVYHNPITNTDDTYALLKSHVYLGEEAHFVPSGLVNGVDEYTPEGSRIFLNTSDHTADYSRYQGCEQGKDLIRVSNPTTPKQHCWGLPDEELIYACRDTAQNCAVNVNYKSDKVPFDVYYRVKDGLVPSPVSTWCTKPTGAAEPPQQQQIVGVPTPGGRQNLQLETFQIKQEEGEVTYDTPWCKPAINLYPTDRTEVNVKVAPKGEMTFTDPVYPADGWTVTAEPDVTITAGNKTYPYLFYEAPISEKLIQEPAKGYVVSYDELGNLFGKLLPELGLNDRETKQFSDYWLKALPQSNFYFIGLLSQDYLDGLAPLTIAPAPQSVLRVSLYFKALDNQVEVSAPDLPSKFIRNGFTVTEWGGIFKKDAKHPFTCLM